MNKELLQASIQKFIDDSLTVNFSKLALQKNPFPNVVWSDVLTQVNSKVKAKEKLPTWYATSKIVYPSKLSIEQTSSETTAAYKANLATGDTLIDLTGGFGIDAFYFSKKIKKVIHCELKSELSEIVEHNNSIFNIQNIDCKTGDSSEILENIDQKFDWIYIDPSRRNDTKGKVFLLQDCLPNVPKNLDFYFQYANNIMIKTAPILDISAGIRELKNVKEIHIVAVNNEVKELLWILEKNYTNTIAIQTVNITPHATEKFDFTFPIEEEIVHYDEPLLYLFEPNSAILKAGAFDIIPKKYGISKLQKHSHLYTSKELIDFPGRIFEIQKRIEYSKKEMKIHLENSKANITTRNFPETVETIRKKWKIKDGGSLYTFFTTDKNQNKIVLLCKKI